MERTGPSDAPPRARGRSVSARTAGLLWLVVLIQLAIPCSYYLVRQDREDERFAWRMFSALRFRSCQVRAFELRDGQEHELRLASELHASWSGALRRGRVRVIERFLRGRCTRARIERASLLRSCREVDKSALPEQRFSLDCDRQIVTRTGEGPLP